MKIIYTLALAALTFGMVSCGESTTAVESGDEAPAAAATPTSVDYLVQAETSTMTWAGTKVIGGGHNGTIGIRKGKITVENGIITSGVLHIDMTTIKDTDLPDEQMAADLVGHLSSPDFFNVAAFPNATFTVTKHANGELGGNLELKGVSREISFPVNMTEADGVVTAAGSVVIDRTQWGVEYGSSLGDATLGDNMDITFKLVAMAEAS